MTTPIAQRFTGQSVLRSEDRRILTGTGRYVDDVQLPGTVHAAFLRSPYAHARIRSVDVSAALEAEGVYTVVTGELLVELLGEGAVGGGGFGGPPPMRFTVLATDKVRLVGDPVAMVVATSRYLAEDALELIDVDYEPLDPVPDAATAQDPASAPVFEDVGTNVLVPPTTTTYGDVDDAFARADRVIHVPLSQHRHQNVPMETRGCVSHFDPETGLLTHHGSNQGVGMTQRGLATALGLDTEAVHVLCGDIGGSFGLKIGTSREELTVAAASRLLGLPVKWIEDRNENLTFSGQAREETMDVQAAVTDDGRILGLRVSMTVDTGAYPGMGAMVGGIVQRVLPGPYRIGALEFTFSALITNKATYVAYRGPWAAETFARERTFDVVADELGIDPIEVRRRNLADETVDPWTMVTGPPLVGVTALQSLERVAQVLDVAAFRERQAAARAEGRYLGLGVATYIESAPGPRGDGPLGRERMRMRLEADGTVTVFTGQMPHGQGHETTFAQIAADQLGVEFEAIRVVVGDSARVPVGFTGGSRAATMAGGASVHTARALRDRILDVAANLLEASVDDLELAEGRVGVAGVPARAMSLADVAVAAAEPGRLPDDVDASLEVQHDFDGGQGGWSGGTHGAVVEVDVGTGLVRIERYVVAEDCGELINPAVVEGQVRGGVAQGIGAVLLEHSAYDSSGNFLAGTFMDYLLPSTTEVPRIEIHHLETVPLDPDVNFRGVGEGGMIVAPPTICNAIEDALEPFGVRVLEQHLPPRRILELIGAIEAI